MQVHKPMEDNRTTTLAENSNAGFSLVEVLISITVLAIISIPLLSYFTESMKYNAKMATEQKATMLAQEILEDLKRQDVLCEKVDESILGPNTKVYEIPYLKPTNTNGYVTTMDPASDIDLTALDRSTGFCPITYHVSGSNASTSKVSDAFDVEINARTEEAAVKENGQELYHAVAIREKKDLVFMEENQSSLALAYFKSINKTYSDENGGSALSDAAIMNKMERTMTLRFSESSGYYVVTIECKYKCSGLRDPADLTEDTFVADSYGQNMVKVADLNETDANGRIYLLFYPSEVKDTLEIKLEPGVTVPTFELEVIGQRTKTMTAIEQTIPAGYQLNIDGYTNVMVPKLYSNIGHIQATTGGLIPTAAGTKFNESAKTLRRVDLTVRVYKKGEVGVVGKEPYVTINGSKIE